MEDAYMNESILKSLLKEYEQKRIYAELDLDNRKKELYKHNPKLEEIEKQLRIHEPRSC